MIDPFEQGEVRVETKLARISNEGEASEVDKVTMTGERMETRNMEHRIRIDFS